MEIKEYWRNHYNKNKEKHIEAVKKCQLKTKLKVFKHYSNGEIKCELCKIDDIVVLTLDHVNGRGNRHRAIVIGDKHQGGQNFYRWIINNNYPDGYRVLCRNCNFKEYVKSKARNTGQQILDKKLLKMGEKE